VLNPLGMVLILHLLFARVLPLKIPHYAAFVYCGLLPWNWFQSAIQIGSAALIDNRDLVRKPFFPRPLLPAVVVTSNFLLYLMAFPVLLLLLLIEGLPLSPALLLLPVVWLAQAAFTLACTILIAAVSVLVRDVQYMLGMVMLLWFYLTPIFYDLERIGADHARWLMLNPLTTMVQAHRDILLSGHAPDWLALGLNALLGSVLLAASLVVFRWLEDAFVEEV
jgi:lipopolysaccharide transport system permease protein